MKPYEPAVLTGKVFDRNFNFFNTYSTIQIIFYSFKINEIFVYLMRHS